MPKPKFVQLNVGWSAEPNAPYPEILIDAEALNFRFKLNPWAYNARDGEHGDLTFDGCSRWRLGPTNDEGWHLGQCRYSGAAPAWGEFYELVGNDNRRDEPTDWRVVPEGSGSRHFLFYLRDETFECMAPDWSFQRGRG